MNDVAGTVGRQAPVVRRIDDRTRALLAAQASAALGAERDETVLLATDSAAARADVGGRRRRLVIAGDDLKFVRPLLPVLERDWEVRVDQWTGPEGHDVELSEELADWADVVWCEWWLGNAVWYSWRLRPEQRLLVRLHLFELGREYLDLTNLDAVDRVVCVSLPMLMELRQRVVLPRGVERVVPNAVAFPPQPPLVETGRDEATSSSKPMNRRYSLALVGGVPARKGLRRAVEVLGALHREDPRYRLDIYGRRADELPWVASDEDQARYFAECEALIDELGVRDAVTWHGWTDLDEVLATHGFVLSPSDFESFHVAPVEGAAAGAVPVVWTWPGAEWSHPRQVLVSSDDDAVARIRELADTTAHGEANRAAVAWYRQRCDPENVARGLLEGLP